MNEHFRICGLGRSQARRITAIKLRAFPLRRRPATCSRDPGEGHFPRFRDQTITGRQIA